MTCGCCPETAVASISSLFLNAFTANPLITLIVSVPIVLALISFYPLLILLTPTQTPPTSEELHYFCPSSADPLPLPTLKDQPTLQLSVIIPAYNEEDRLTEMLDEAVKYLEDLRKNGESLVGKVPSESAAEDEFRSPLIEKFRSYEILIVDDGSKDRTSEIALEYAGKFKKEYGGENEIRVVKLERNRGKGGAVRHGILHSRGSHLLFADADGATKFSDLKALCSEMNRILTPTGHGIVVGSRAHMVGSEAVVKRSKLRNFLMHSFHLLLSLLLRPPTLSLPKFLSFNTFTSKLTTRISLPTQPEIKDTQCGFKLFSRQTASLIFPLSHIDRWIFDVELLLLAEMAGEVSMRKGLLVNRSRTKEYVDDEVLKLPLPISEIPVEWKEIGGSKIDLLKDSIGMAMDLVIIRANYGLGRWRKPGGVEVEKKR